MEQNPSIHTTQSSDYNSKTNSSLLQKYFEIILDSPLIYIPMHLKNELLILYKILLKPV